MWIPILVLLGLIAGRFRLPLWLGWLLVIALIAGANFTLLGEDPIFRMVGICAVLLAGMKGLVYAAWGGQFGWGRYFVYSLTWFGMDPASFLKRREGLSYRGDLAWGLALTVTGALGAWLVWAMEWRQILVMFLPMSLAFHFGFLRILKGLHRKAGFPVRTLFPNLLKATGVGDFWSRRWNVGYSQMMQRLVGRPVEGVFGRKTGIFSVFVVSGLFHEVAITLPVNAGYGLPTAYFVGHGLLVLLEGKIRRSVGKVFALLAVGVPLGFLFPPEFQTEVIARCLEIFKIIL